MSVVLVPHCLQCGSLLPKQARNKGWDFCRRGCMSDWVQNHVQQLISAAQICSSGIVPRHQYQLRRLFEAPNQKRLRSLYEQRFTPRRAPLIVEILTELTDRCQRCHPITWEEVRTELGSHRACPSCLARVEHELTLRHRLLGYSSKHLVVDTLRRIQLLCSMCRFIWDRPERWWEQVDSDRLNLAPGWFQKLYHNDRTRWRKQRCHVCWERFHFEENPRALDKVRELGGDVEKVLSIGGRRCLSCLADHFLPFGNTTLWMWREDVELSACEFETTIVPAQGEPVQLTTSQTLVVRPETNGDVLLLTQGDALVGKLPIRHARRVHPELVANIAWHGTVTPKERRHGQTQTTRALGVLEDCGVLPAHIVQRMHNRKAARGFYAVDFESRWKVFERDGFACVYCGAHSSTERRLTVDHLIPRRAGGSDEINNLVTCCFPCNAGKNSTILDEAKIMHLREHIARHPESATLVNNKCHRVTPLRITARATPTRLG